MADWPSDILFRGPGGYHGVDVLPLEWTHCTRDGKVLHGVRVLAPEGSYWVPFPEVGTGKKSYFLPGVGSDSVPRAYLLSALNPPNMPLRVRGGDATCGLPRYDHTRPQVEHPVKRTSLRSLQRNKRVTQRCGLGAARLAVDPTGTWAVTAHPLLGRTLGDSLAELRAAFPAKPGHCGLGRMLCEQISRALTRVHHQGNAIHCRVKPGHLAWLPRHFQQAEDFAGEHLTLIDFKGCVEKGAHDDPTLYRHKKNEAPYAAYEQVLPDMGFNMSDETDVWALGATLLEAVCAPGALQPLRADAAECPERYAAYSRWYPTGGKSALGRSLRELLARLPPGPSGAPDWQNFERIFQALVEEPCEGTREVLYALLQQPPALQGVLRDGTRVAGCGLSASLPAPGAGAQCAQAVGALRGALEAWRKSSPRASGAPYWDYLRAKMSVIDPALADLAHACMHPNPTRRPAEPALTALLEGQAVEVDGVSLRSVQPQPGDREAFSRFHEAEPNCTPEAAERLEASRVLAARGLPRIEEAVEASPDDPRAGVRLSTWERLNQVIGIFCQRVVADEVPAVARRRVLLELCRGGLHLVLDVTISLLIAGVLCAPKALRWVRRAGLAFWRGITGGSDLHCAARLFVALRAQLGVEGRLRPQAQAAHVQALLRQHGYPPSLAEPLLDALQIERDQSGLAMRFETAVRVLHLDYEGRVPLAVRGRRANLKIAKVFERAGLEACSLPYRLAARGEAVAQEVAP